MSERTGARRTITRPPRRPGGRRRWYSGLLVLLAIVALVVAGCTSATNSNSPSSQSSAPGGSGSQPASSSASSAALEAEFKGVVTAAPPTSGPKAVKGKTVWLLNCVAYSACEVKGQAFAAAAKVLGWKVKTLDDKADATTTIKEIGQAISAHVDGIVIIPEDCPLIKSGLLQAKAAHIPVLDYGGLDCNDPSFGSGGSSLYAAPVKVLGTTNQSDLFGTFGKEDADFMAASLSQQGITSGTIVAVENHDQVIHTSMSKAFEAEMKVKCPGCTVKEVLFTVAQQSNGQGPQIFKTGLLANPSAIGVYYQIGSLMSKGLQTAIASSGQHYKIICCGDGSGPDIDYAMAHQTAAEVAVHVQPATYVGWALADELNRIFAGESATAIPDEGGYELYIDKSHPLGNPPVNFQADYTKVWTGS